MDSGYIYIYINATMPGLVKIGKTERTPDQRGAELYGHTGVPVPFTLAWEERVSSCSQAEREIHERLDYCRENPRREFFRILLKDAIQVASEVVVKYRQPEPLVSECSEPDRS